MWGMKSSQPLSATGRTVIWQGALAFLFAACVSGAPALLDECAKTIRVPNSHSEEGKLQPPASSGPSTGPAEQTHFLSRLALTVWVVDDDGASRTVGHTPTERPLAIPKCRWWGVTPLRSATARELTDEALRSGFTGLYLTGVTDADLRELKRFPAWQDLGLSSSSLTDAGLEQLQGMTDLTRLN